jgi:hypothetical protein
MTIAEAPAGSASAIFDLIAPFSESADARLRGNAVQALAALVGGRDKSLHQQAMDEIVRVVTAEPSGSGALDWQRRFAARSLDALARLQPAERQLVGQRILATSSSQREPERRAAIARLSLAAMGHDRRLWTAGWIRWLQLVRLAARSGFWITLWAVLWRTAAVCAIFQSAEAAAPWFSRGEEFGESIGRYIVIALVIAMILTISALLSISGRIRPPLGISIADTAVSAATFVLLIIIVTAWQELTPEFTTELSVRDVLALCALGFVLGALVRAARWVALAAAIEPNGTAVGFRPLAAFAVTTLVCILAGKLGMHMRAAAEGWMVLAPATMIAAWLDVWLEDREPHPFSEGRARTDSRWAIPVLAGSAIILSGWLIYQNLTHALEGDAALQLTPLQDGLQSAQVIEKVRLPSTSDSNSATTVTAGFGHRIPMDADVEGSYEIVAKANPDERITLFLIKRTPDQHIVAKSSGDQLHPPIITKKLEKGSDYSICVMPEAQPNCSLSIVANLRHFDMLVIDGNIWREIDTHAAHTISISPVRSP